MKKSALSILLLLELVAFASEGDEREAQEEIRLQQLYDFNPHLLPAHEALRLGSTSTSAAPRACCCGRCDAVWGVP